MRSTSFRESSTMSKCSGPMAFRVPNSSSVLVFTATPCPALAGISVLDSYLLGRTNRLPGCKLSGSLNSLRSQSRLDTVEEFGKRHGLLGGPETGAHAELQRTPGTNVAIEHGDPLFQTLANHWAAGLRRVHAKRRHLRFAKTTHNALPAQPTTTHVANLDTRPPHGP